MKRSTLKLQKERKARRARKARKELEAAPVEPQYREYTPEPADEFICTPIYTAPEPEPVPVESAKPWYRFGH